MWQIQAYLSKEGASPTCAKEDGYQNNAEDKSKLQCETGCPLLTSVNCAGALGHEEQAAAWKDACSTLIEGVRGQGTGSGWEMEGAVARLMDCSALGP